MKSLTVIIPAYNEEGNIADTVADVVPSVEKHFDDYEILIFNDNSADGTGRIADSIAAKNKKVKVIHNLKNMGLGYNYKAGVKMSYMDYCIMVPGDRDILASSFDGMFSMVGQKDIVLAYSSNLEVRPPTRRFLSRAFTRLMNTLFCMDLKYFNGMVIHKCSLIKGIEIKTDGFAYQAEALIKLIKSGATYAQAPQFIRERSYGKSKALGPRNVYRVLKSILQIFVEIHFKKQKAV